MTSETRYMRNSKTTNEQYPTAYNLISGSLSSGGLSDLQSSNNVYLVLASALVGSEQHVEIEFTGSLAGHIPFLQFLAELKTSVAAAMTIAVYDYVAGAYETTGTMYKSTTTTTEDANYWLYHILANTKYRNGSNTWKVKLKFVTTGSPAPSFTVSIDYLYLRSIFWDIGTAQTDSATGPDAELLGVPVGVRVWKINSDDTETEITSGSSVAVVTNDDETCTLSATWSCPGASDVVAVIVGVYGTTDLLQTADPSSGGYPMLFVTEDLNTTLAAATWTVYYAFWYSSFLETVFLRFGSSTYDTRITNFTYGAVAVSQPMGDGFTFVV